MGASRTHKVRGGKTDCSGTLYSRWRYFFTAAVISSSTPQATRPANPDHPADSQAPLRCRGVRSSAPPSALSDGHMQRQRHRCAFWRERVWSDFVRHYPRPGISTSHTHAPGRPSRTAERSLAGSAPPCLQRPCSGQVVIFPLMLPPRPPGRRVSQPQYASSSGLAGERRRGWRPVRSPALLGRLHVCHFHRTRVITERMASIGQY